MKTRWKKWCCFWKNLQDDESIADFVTLRGQKYCEIKFQPIYTVKKLMAVFLVSHILALERADPTNNICHSLWVLFYCYHVPAHLNTASGGVAELVKFYYHKIVIITLSLDKPVPTIWWKHKEPQHVIISVWQVNHSTYWSIFSPRMTHGWS